MGMAMRIELTRKGIAASDPKRAVELAAYFTHCNLQPAHTMLSLRSAMTAAYKMQLFGSASSFARRLLELNPKPDIATQARKVIQLCDGKADAQTLQYDEKNPFVICGQDLVPIYRGSALVHCPYC